MIKTGPVKVLNPAPGGGTQSTPLTGRDRIQLDLICTPSVLDHRNVTDVGKPPLMADGRWLSHPFVMLAFGRLIVNTIALQIADEAVDSFIGYLSGYVVELTLADAEAGSEPLVVVVDSIGRTDEGFMAIEVRTYDEDQMGATGKPFIVDFDLVRAITVF